MSLVEVVSTAEALVEAQALRLEVFVHEQHVPLAEEIDAADSAPSTIHVVARQAPGGPVVGTARLLTDPATPGEVHVGRLAVAAASRGSGVGAELMAALESIARADHAVSCRDGTAGVTVLLSAQLRAVGFYERLGYVIEGPEYLDAGIVHRDAAKTLLREAGPDGV